MPAGKPSTGATTPRPGSCSELCFHAPRVPCTRGIPLHIRVEGTGQGLRVVGLEGFATSLLRVWHGLLAIVDLVRIRNTCPNMIYFFLQTITRSYPAN
jgi:hypothetical protein